MKYYVEDLDETFDTPEEAVDNCIEEDYYDTDSDDFEDWVNESYSGVYIAETDYNAYDILDRFGDLCNVIDEFRSEMNDRDREDTLYELNHAKVGQMVWCQRHEIEVVDDEEEEEEEEPDVDYVEQTRRFYDEQSCLMKIRAQSEKKKDEELLQMFQVI